MKNSHQITINKSIQEVMDLFQDPTNFKHWQQGLIASTPISGDPGKVGSKRRMKIKTSVAVIEMVEEITARDLPHLWEATYRTKGVVNYQSNRFRESEITKNHQTIQQTVWNATTVFKFTGMMRLVAKARPQVFESQTIQFMKDFKRFAEEGTSVATT